MLLLWERGLLFLLLLMLVRLGWLNAALGEYMTRTPPSYLAEGLLLLGLMLAWRTPQRLRWLAVSLGWAAVLAAALGGSLADESGGAGNALPEMLVGLFALASLILTFRRHNKKL